MTRSERAAQQKKINVDDVLCEIELEQIAAAKHKGNGNGAEQERVNAFVTKELSAVAA